MSTQIRNNIYYLRLRVPQGLKGLRAMVYEEWWGGHPNCCKIVFYDQPDWINLCQRSVKNQKDPCLVSRTTILTMVYKLGLSAEKGWRKLRGFRRLADVINGVKFIDGVDEETFELQRNAAWSCSHTPHLTIARSGLTLFLIVFQSPRTQEINKTLALIGKSLVFSGFFIIIILLFIITRVSLLLPPPPLTTCNLGSNLNIMVKFWGH